MSLATARSGIGRGHSISPEVTIKLKRTIRASPRAVFELYCDPLRLPEWQLGATALLDMTGGLDQPGTSYVLDQPGPRLRIEVLRVDPPSLHRQLETFGRFAWIGTATFHPRRDGGTSFAFEYSRPANAPWYWLPVMTVLAFFFGRAEFDRLKRLADRLH